jgi:hypothetical protein
MGTTTLPGAVGSANPQQRQFYQNMADVPATGGWMRPPAAPGQPQGMGLNWVVPPPPPRQQLAGMMGGGLLGQGLVNAIDGPGSPNYRYHPALDPRGGR